MKKLTTRQLIKKFSGAPWDEMTLACAVIDQLTADSPLVMLAFEFRTAREEFLLELETLGFEIG